MGATFPSDPDLAFLCWFWPSSAHFSRSRRSLSEAAHRASLVFCLCRGILLCSFSVEDSLSAACVWLQGPGGWRMGEFFDRLGWRHCCPNHS